MRWYVPFNKLKSKQVSVLDGITRQLEARHWIQGFAGTGKTVVMTHVIERVAGLRPQASLCFITYTHALKDLVATGFYGPVVHRVHMKTHKRFLKDAERYDYVFLDEVQDIEARELERIKSLADHLYLAGDPDQRIYDHGAREEEIEASVRPVIWSLLESIRLTRVLREAALAIFPSAKVVEGSAAGNGADATIRLKPFADRDTEVEWVWKEALYRAGPGDPSVILFPTHEQIGDFARRLAQQLGVAGPPWVAFVTGKGRDYEPFNEHWVACGVPFVYLGSSFGSLPDSDVKPLVYAMTFHSAKGLDFRNVFIPGLNWNTVIVSDKALRKDPELDRRLLFVAVTRSRENLFISYSAGRPHRYVEELPQTVVSETRGLVNRGEDEEDFF